MIEIAIITRSTIYPTKLMKEFSQLVSSSMPGKRLQEVGVKNILAYLWRQEHQDGMIREG
jgi:hypothetical protein